MESLSLARPYDPLSSAGQQFRICRLAQGRLGAWKYTILDKTSEVSHLLVTPTTQLSA